MQATIEALQERDSLKQLEEEAAVIARSYFRRSRSPVQAIIVARDKARRRRAYLSALKQTMEAMTESMKQTSTAAEASSCELLSAIEELERMETEEEEELLSRDEVKDLMDRNVYVNCGDIVKRVNESLYAIREMLYDMKVLADGESRGSHAAAAAGEAASDEEQNVLNRVPSLLQHTCASLYPEPDEEPDLNGNDATGGGTSAHSEAWVALEEKMWRLGQDIMKYREERNEKMGKNMRKLREAEAILEETRARDTDGAGDVAAASEDRL